MDTNTSTRHHYREWLQAVEQRAVSVNARRFETAETREQQVRAVTRSLAYIHLFRRFVRINSGILGA